LILSISSLLIALNQGQKEGWDSLYIVSLFYTAGAAMVLFIMVELYVKQPMIELTLFRNKNFAIANIIGFLSFVAMYGAMFLLPFFLKTILNYSSMTAGIMLLPMTATMVVFAPVGGRLADRFGSRLPTACGILLISLAIYLLSQINPDFSSRNFFIRLVMLGIGLGFTMSPLSNCAIASLPKDKIGVGSGVFNLAKIIGGSIGVVFVETLLTNREIHHSQVLNAYLNPAVRSTQELYSLLRTLWGDKGMDNQLLSEALHGWSTGRGLLPEQYAQFKLLLGQMLQQHASVLSFEDVFFALSLLCLCGAFFSFFITGRRAEAD